MIEISKLTLLKLLILLLITLKTTYVLSYNFSEISTEQIIKSYPDEMEIEVETETTYFQKIAKNTVFVIIKNTDLKAPVFKNTFFHKIHSVEFSTPPPEFRS